MDSVPRERYASLDQLAPGDRIWLDGAWRTVTATNERAGDIGVFLADAPGLGFFAAPAALLVRRAET